jgi:DNA-binding LytR/AlgR family response regulator
MERSRAFIYSADQGIRDQLLTLVEQCPLLEVAGVASTLDEIRLQAPEGAGLLLLDVGAGENAAYASIGHLQHAVPIVVLADRPDQAVEAFTQGVVDFILKPIDVSRFHRAVGRAVKGITRQAHAPHPIKGHGTIELKSGKGVVQVRLEDIHLVQGMGNYVKLHLHGGNVIANATMSQMEQALPAARFVRVHRSFIVAIDQVRSIGSRTIGCRGREIPIGGFFRRQALERIGALVHH